MYLVWVDTTEGKKIEKVFWKRANAARYLLERK